MDGHCREDLEERRVTGKLRASRAPVDGLPDALERFIEWACLDVRPADADPFLRPDKVGRSVETCREARGAEDRLQHGGDGALAVGAGDENRGERALRVTENGAEAAAVLQTELHAELLEVVQPGQPLFAAQRYLQCICAGSGRTFGTRRASAPSRGQA